jgi:threonine/homoserine/homoserine lactone efflux protein
MSFYSSCLPEHASRRKKMELFGLTQATHLQTDHLWVFFAMVFGIIVLPGLDMAYVLASSLVGGRKAGAAALLGIVVGGMVHTLMGVIGVGVVIGATPKLFNVMLLAGAAYIAWIGVSLLRGASALGEVQTGPPRTLMAVFAKGAATCLVNPKAYAFMLAVFPQFLKPEYGPISTQALLLGGIIALTQILIYGSVALGAAQIRLWLRGNAAAQVRAGQLVGLLLIAGAVWTGWQGWLRW